MANLGTGTLTLTVTAAQDFTFRCFVTLAGIAGDPAIGIIRDPADTGDLLDVVMSGTAYCRVGAGGVTKGAGVKPDADGKAILCGSGDTRSGIARVAAAEGDDVEILIIQQPIEP